MTLVGLLTPVDQEICHAVESIAHTEKEDLGGLVGTIDVSAYASQELNVFVYSM